MPDSKLTQILARVRYVLPRTPLEYFPAPARRLAEWKAPHPGADGPHRLEEATPPERFRKFRIDVQVDQKPAGALTGGPSRADDTTRAWYETFFTVAVGYPDTFGHPDLTSPTSVSVVALSDAHRLIEAVGRLSPFHEITPVHALFDPEVGVLPALGDVDEARYAGFSFTSGVGRTGFRLVYAESNAIEAP